MILQKAIFATLAYHDLFDYPLSTFEIHNFLISKEASVKSVEKELSKLKVSKKVSENQGYWHLSRRSKIVSLRITRKRYSREKNKRAVFFANLLKIIPTIKLVAISGALAMENSHKKDDIDFVIVASKKRLWTTRFLANTLLLPFKRSPKSENFSNRACLNVFLDETDLTIAPQNVYLAHEICQAKLLWDRDNTYQKFIEVNSWVKKYLPNWTSGSPFTVHGSQRTKLSTVSRQPSAIENFLRNFQFWYMRSKITTEKIGKTQLFFHPADTQNWVRQEFQKRLKKLNLSQKSLLYLL